MSVFYKFQDIFDYLLDAQDREQANRMIEREFEMSYDFKEHLQAIKDAPTRVEGEAIVNKIMFDKHARFARELAEVLDAVDRTAGDKVIDYLLDKMDKYIELLQSIKDAPTREEGDAIIRGVQEEIKNYKKDDFYRELRAQCYS